MQRSPTPRRLPLALRAGTDPLLPECADDLIEIIYMSDAAPSLEDDTIVDILRAAEDYNTRRNITGLLLYDGQRFLQVMEGERRHVADLYADILEDDRHRNVVTIHEGRIDARVFDDWGMAYQRIRPDSDILLLARRQMETGRAVDPLLTDVGKWIAASLDPPDSYVWSRREREPG